jgi:hypothetical protein
MVELRSPFSLAVSIELMALTTYWESETTLSRPGKPCRAARTAKTSACCAVTPRVVMFIYSVHVPKGKQKMYPDLPLLVPSVYTVIALASGLVAVMQDRIQAEKLKILW